MSNMSLTVDSDLNGASSQFTLTCISTGGPATTVTWTRDSDTVTEGNETVLDDRVTAQYTHTLTVTGRLGGLYTCTVANDKPSVTHSNISVQGVYTNYYCSNTCTNSMYKCMKKVHNLRLASAQQLSEKLLFCLSTRFPPFS